MIVWSSMLPPLLITVIFLSFPYPLLPAWAGPCPDSSGSPCKTIRDTAQQVLHILRESPSRNRPPRQKRLERVWHAILPHVDRCGMAMRSLPADYLPRMTKPQKEEFTNLYSRLLIQGYSRVLRRYGKDTRVRLLYDQEYTEEGHARVRLKVITPWAEHVITYSLYREWGRWLIYDVIHGAVSQGKNYRAQFDRVGRKSGYDYGYLGKLITSRLDPGLVSFSVPRVKMRLWGICQRER